MFGCWYYSASKLQALPKFLHLAKSGQNSLLYSRLGWTGLDNGKDALHRAYTWCIITTVLSDMKSSSALQSIFRLNCLKYNSSLCSCMEMNVKHSDFTFRLPGHHNGAFMLSISSYRIHPCVCSSPRMLVSWKWKWNMKEGNERKEMKKSNRDQTGSMKVRKSRR